MAEGARTSYSQLAESLTAVKQNQDQFQQNHHALQQMVQGLAQKLDVMASHVEAMVQQKNAQNTGEPGGFSQITNPIYEDNAGIQTRATRLDFPRFNGDNPSGWIYHANQFFTYHQTNPFHRVLMASFHMEGKALVWFQDIEVAGGFNSWEGFIQALQTRFGSSPYEDPMKTKTSTHAATKLTPFESVSSYPFPPKLMQIIPGTTKLQEVKNTLKTQDEILSVLQAKLQQAQEGIRKYADRRQTDRNFEEGDWVDLRLQPYKQRSVAQRKNVKLSNNSNGNTSISPKPSPFLSYDYIRSGSVLVPPPFSTNDGGDCSNNNVDFPDEYRLDDYLSFLDDSTSKNEGFMDQGAQLGGYPVANGDSHLHRRRFSESDACFGDKNGVVRPEPEFMGRKMTERKGKAVTEVLAKWRGLGAEEVSWVVYAEMAESSLTLRARSFKGGGIVTCPYERRGNVTCRLVHSSQVQQQAFVNSNKVLVKSRGTDLIILLGLFRSI